MKRSMEWMDKPITWRASIMMTAIGTVIAGIYGLVAWIVLCEPAWWRATKNFVHRLIYKW